MGSAQWVLELALLLLLAATLFHALRLERALGVLKRDRAVLEELVQGFNESTRQAESGIERLRVAAEGAGRQMSRQIESAQILRDDLNFLADRSDRLAERLEAAVRSARMFADRTALSEAFPTVPAASSKIQPVSPADTFGRTATAPLTMPVQAATGPTADAADEVAPRLRSQAERDLLRALRAGH